MPGTSFLCCVTDRRRFGLSLSALVDLAHWAAACDVDLIQVRERDLSDRELVCLAQSIVAAARGSRTRVLVNDRVDVAIAAGAAGVHLRGDSIAAPGIRSLAPPDFIVGRSVHTLDEARARAAEGTCDYLLFGTVFPSRGKPEGHVVAGVDALAAVCQNVRVPVVAIGGIDARRAREAAAAGAAGIAAVELFMTASNEASMRERVDAVRRACDTPFAGSLR